MADAQVVQQESTAATVVQQPSAAPQEAVPPPKPSQQVTFEDAPPTSDQKPIAEPVRQRLSVSQNKFQVRESIVYEPKEPKEKVSPIVTKETQNHLRENAPAILEKPKEEIEIDPRQWYVPISPFPRDYCSTSKDKIELLVHNNYQPFSPNTYVATINGKPRNIVVEKEYFEYISQSMFDRRYSEEPLLDPEARRIYTHLPTYYKEGALKKLVV